VVARIRARWPATRIMLRAESGFAREDLMVWCEANDVDFVFGLAQNGRLIGEIKSELDQVAAKSARTGRPQRRFKAFMWRTRKSWSRRRRVVTKAEWTKGEANPRFIVTSLRGDQGPQLSPQECANYFTHFNMSGIRFSNESRSSERLKYTQMPPLSPYTLLISS